MQDSNSDHLITQSIDLYNNCPACICCGIWAEAVVADSSKEDGHSRELRAGDPILVCYREGENYKEDGEDKIEVRFKVVPAKVCLCLLHIKARFKPCQQRRQGTKVLPGLEKGGKFTSERK